MIFFDLLFVTNLASYFQIVIANKRFNPIKLTYENTTTHLQSKPYCKPGCQLHWLFYLGYHTDFDDGYTNSGFCWLELLYFRFIQGLLRKAFVFSNL
jgi:hypothetical protein